MNLELSSNSAKATKEFGYRLGKICQAGDWIGLTGELGAGKTCLVQGIALGLGVDPKIPVTSPTFVILQSYLGRIPLHHLDLYRIKEDQELQDIGYQDLLGGDGVCVVEWCERIPRAIPEFGMMLELEIIDQKSRRIVVIKNGRHNSEILGKLKLTNK